ncbi:MAG TPA: hypothetical protein VF045_09645 [Acidimicrobiales bacterium]
MSRLRLVLVTVTIGGAALALQLAGRGALAPPPLADPASWGDWLARREPIEAAMALIRLAALVFLWYLAGAALVGTALRLVRAERLVAVTDRLTVPLLRRLLVATASVSLASGVSPALLVGRGPVAAAVAVTTEAPSTTTSTTTTVDGRTDPTLTMRLLPVESAPAAPAQPAEARLPSQARTAAVTWTVVPGESFWSIAEDVLAQAWGRAPTDAEIVPYWRTLIDANRAELADRANEHLIFPGQIFAVPSPPSPR